MGHSQSSSHREVCSNANLPQETTKTANIVTLHLKELEKEEENPKLVEGKKS